MPKRSFPIDGQKLRNLRGSKGWSREKLAEIADCDPATVKKAEGGGAIDHKIRRRIADALAVEPQDLMATPAHSQSAPDGAFGLR
jgi:transcriptional regulator with XRE-family HTH domain